jgi:hypothetical protein
LREKIFRNREEKETDTGGHRRRRRRRARSDQTGKARTKREIRTTSRIIEMGLPWMGKLGKDGILSKQKSAITC